MTAVATPKPRLIYFRWSLEKAPQFVQRLFHRTFIQGLSAHFDLVVVSENCDYGAVCERYRPDLALFESGNNGYQDPPLRISNTAAHPQIPKIGFLRSDPACASRTIFFGDMDRWGVETFFTYVTGAGEYTPEVRDNLFYWNFFVDTSIYRDFGLDKIIPVLFLGNSDGPQYAWRRALKQIMATRFPTFVGNHPGWHNASAAHALYDEDFARLINAAHFAPTCGAVYKVLVNKHLEIPAARSCLVTEKTPVLEAAGFADMVNCVFADKHDVVDKLDFLLKNRQVLEEITENGYRLVRTRHTVAQRAQIRQWFELRKNLRPHQKIVQPGLFGDLTLADRGAAVSGPHLISAGQDRLLLQRATALLQQGKFAEAESCLRLCLEFKDYMAEPKLLLALCNLYRGNPAAALEWVAQPLELTFSWNGLEPDPVEWGYFLIILLCLGRLAEAVRNARLFPGLRRRELDRARWAVFTLADLPQEAYLCEISGLDPHPGSRRSLHAPSPLSAPDWQDTLELWLNSCGQPQFRGLLRPDPFSASLTPLAAAPST